MARLYIFPHFTRRFALNAVPSKATIHETPLEQEELVFSESQEAPDKSPSLLRRLVDLFPAGQFVRYLAVGVWNTIFGYLCYAGSLFLFSHFLPHRWLPLTADIAYVAAIPVSITMSYFCYKFFVFKTQGNYLREWLRCFAVYGTGMIPVLLALPVLTRAFQQIHGLTPSAAPLLAGAVTTGFTTIYSYIGHRNFSFRQKRATK